jgi:DNA-binding winged helix-turn-helix (wHTH) protein/tetratricopeptide (TPR) repeat protein
VLLRQGHSVPVSPRALDVLVALVERRGAPLTKEELLRRVWGDAAVEENNLSVGISALRKALGEGVRDHRYILTLSRRGYSFVAPVTERSADGIAEDLRGGRHDSHVLLLPFEAVGDTRVAGAEKRLGRLISEGLAAHLAASQHVTLVAPSASDVADSAPLVTLGRRMRAAFIMRGSVQIDGARIRVHVRLVRTSDGTTAWGLSIEETTRDLFSAEGRIVARVSQGLTTHLQEEMHQRSARRMTQSDEAHRHYIRGRYFWNKRSEQGLKTAIEYFERAAHADPGYALPYSGLADCFLLLSTYGAISPRQGVPRAVRAANRALEIDDTVAEAYTSIGYARFAYYWRPDEAETQFRRAIELNPEYATGHHLYGDHLAATGRFDEAVAALERALSLEPLSLIINTDLAWILYHARRPAEAAEQLKRTIEMDAGFMAAHWVLGLTHHQAGELEMAIEELEQARRLAPDSAHVLGSLSAVLAEAGREAQADAVLDVLRRLSEQKYVSPYHFAVAAVRAGKKQEALRALREAVTDRAHWVAYFSVAPMLDPLRDDPEFRSLLQYVDTRS